MSDFHFVRPLWLIIGPVLLLVAIFLLRISYKKSSIANFCDQELVKYLFKSAPASQNYGKFLILAALTLLLLAMAGPSFSKQEIALHKPRAATIIALDLSTFMNLSDIKPSRLERAIFKIKDFLSRKIDFNIALTVFTNKTHVVTPITDSAENIAVMLPALSSEIMPTKGQSVLSAVVKAEEIFNQANVDKKALFLLTPQVKTAEVDKIISTANQAGIKVYILGIGNEQQSESFQKDEAGNLRSQKLAKKQLQRIANATGGLYQTIRGDDLDIENIYAKVKNLFEASKTETSEKSKLMWQDQGFYLVIAALPLVLLLFRRGLFISLLIFTAASSYGSSFSDYFKNGDQLGKESFDQENYTKALQKFQDPSWQAACQYKCGDYEAAKSFWEQQTDEESIYNLANCLVKQNELEKALQKYNELLEVNPSHADGKYNKELIEKMLNEQQKNSSSQDSQDQDKQDQNKSEQDKSDQSKSDQGSQDQNKSDQDSQDQSKSDQTKSDQSKSDHDSADQKQEHAEDQQAEDKIEESQPENQAEPQEQSTQQASSEEASKEDEQKEIDAKWLDRVADNPGAYLKRKFWLEAKKQQG